MRKDSTPQVETREISDSDLDNVSGGLLGQVVDTVWTVDSMLPSVSDLTVTAATGVDTSSNVSIAGI